ncbi:MAG: ATP-binding protein [Chloroflexi bacterium]|nr:ATP-binding protein [Chloroflexota bacterium]
MFKLKRIFRKKKSSIQEFSLEEATVELTLADRITRRLIHNASATDLAHGTLTDLTEFMSIDWATLALIDEKTGTVNITRLIPQKDPLEEHKSGITDSHKGTIENKIAATSTNEECAVASVENNGSKHPLNAEKTDPATGTEATPEITNKQNINSAYLTNSPPIISTTITGASYKEYTVPFAGSAFEWVLRERKALYQPDTNKDKQSDPTLVENIRTAVYMPLFYQSKVFGTLNAGTYLPNMYSNPHLKLLKYSTSQLAASIKNALLLEENRRIEESLNNINDILRILTSHTSLIEAFPPFAEHLSTIIHFDQIRLSKVEGRLMRLIAHHPYTSFIENESYLVDKTSIPWLIKHKDINIEQDLSLNKQFNNDENYLTEKYLGVIRIPLFSSEQLFACLHLFSYKPYHFTQHEIDFLRLLSAHLATPVENFLLNQYEQQRLDWLNALLHYLKTPLTPITSSSSLLLDELLRINNPTASKIAQNIYSGARSIERNINLFWDLSDMYVMNENLLNKYLNISNLVYEVAEDLSVVLRSKSQELKLSCPQGPLLIWGDQTKLRRLIALLIEHAAAHSPFASSIDLRVEYLPEYITITITDNGTAFNQVEINKFNKAFTFAMADQESQPILILIFAISRRIVELHGGSFTVESNNKGNMYRFTIPNKSIE